MARKKSSLITESYCEQIIRESFDPLANELGLELVRVRHFTFAQDHPYHTLVGIPVEQGGEPVQLREIVSSDFALRIRVGVGPWTDRVVTDLTVNLAPSTTPLGRWDEPEGVAILWVAHYYGDATKYEGIYNRRDLAHAAQRDATLAATYCRPFLLGQNAEDFPKIKQVVEEQMASAAAESRKLLANLPSSVKPMWRLEGESFADWEKRIRREKAIWDAKHRRH